jgi:hypothetical protein
LGTATNFGGDVEEPALTRYVNQTLALHKALALLRMNRLAPGDFPEGVEMAIHVLEEVTEPRNKRRPKAMKVPEATNNASRLDRAHRINKVFKEVVDEDTLNLMAEWDFNIGPDGEPL